MFGKDSQFISILKYNTQLKIDFKKLKNENLDKTEESTFIIHDEILPRDIASKINQWQESIPKTFISTLCLCADEKIINKTNKRLVDYTKVQLNNSFDVVVKKEKLFEVEHYFEFTGLDYVFSPFQILNQHLEQNPTSNTLVVLTVSDYIYIVIVNELNKIVFNKIHKVPDFKDIKESRFYSSDVLGQKLYDEVYSLELQNFISKTLKEYYKNKSDNFVEKVDILYTIKQLSDEQLQDIEDDLMISVHYHYISLKDSIYELSRGPNRLLQSYVKPRPKKGKSSTKWILLLLVFLFAISGSGIYYKEKVIDFVQKIKQMKKEDAPKSILEKKIALPNHININDEIKDDLLILLESIPYDMVIDSLEIKKDNSTITGKMLAPDSYIKDIQPKLLQFYKYSNIQIKDSKNIALDVMIYNSDPIFKDSKSLYTKALPKYLADGFMPVKRVSDQLKIVLPKSAVLVYESTFNLNISTYNFKVNMVISSPIEFFRLLESLNKELYSINISYPIIFLKNQDSSIEVSFGLQFNQNL
ncbi:MAG: hypothetical protein ACNI28_04930 [Arcobacter sp.]|uniref:hypothetical protein n=1 Tax=Arcobacter sp. TaxID=1872629 RepID=UPI003AFF9106